MAYTPEQFKAMLEERGIYCTDRQWQVLCLRLGLEDGIPKSQEETAEILGITRERVRSIESMILCRGHHAKRRKKIRDFYT
jgi:DNA-directed RNA polymerase sigma subunit (sigma70/sigma32)